MPAPQFPDFADPAGPPFALPFAHRHDIAGRIAEPALEGADHAKPRFRIGELRIERIDIGRKLALDPQPRRRIFIGRQHVIGRDAEPFGNAGCETFRLVGAGR